MRREGRVTGHVRRRSDSRAVTEEYERELQDLGFDGPFRLLVDGHERIKLSNRATNESKDSSRCRRSGCRGCHACPTSKALAKAKGRNKPRCSRDSRGRNPLAPRLDASMSELSAFEAQIDECDDDDDDDDDGGGGGECNAVSSEEIAVDDDDGDGGGGGGCNAVSSEEIAVANEHYYADPNQNLSVKCDDSSNVVSQDVDRHLLDNHGVYDNHAVGTFGDISELPAENSTNDFVVVNGNAAQSNLQSLPSGQKEFPPISEELHTCDDAISEWYQVAYPPDESDDDDWHLIID